MLNRHVSLTDENKIEATATGTTPFPGPPQGSDTIKQRRLQQNAALVPSLIFSIGEQFRGYLLLNNKAIGVDT